MNTIKVRHKIHWPLVAFLGLLGIFALGGGFYLSKHMQKHLNLSEDLAAALLLPQPEGVSTFHLTDNSGRPFTNEDLKGHWTFLFFGFTRCSAICPTTMAELTKAYQLLKRKGIVEPVFVFISIDPERDSSNRINTYVTAFNKAFKGASGSVDEIKRLTRNMRILVTKVNLLGPKTQEYTIDHTGTLMLINPQGNLAAVFSMPHDGRKIANDFTIIQSHNS